MYDVDLERDWLGRIEHRAEALAGADLDCTYGYDDASRLASADCGAGVVSYTYDLNGNRLTRNGPGGDGDGSLRRPGPAALRHEAGRR